MFSCKDIAEKASDYLDSSMPWYRRMGYFFHLLMCCHCRRFVRQFRVMVAMVAKIPAQNSADVDEIAKKLHQQQQKQ